MGHTPGPWHTDNEIVPWLSGEAPGVCVRAYNADGAGSPVCMVQPHLSGKYRVAGSLHPIEDARLIAAAPELLDALTELYAVVQGECPSLLDEDSGGCARLDLAIRAAIAKATTP